ncbi:ribonuclease HII [Halonotius pteroides]|uniref:Ribonuclease HII n=1 Tax=Halonotius pteroides TaxID=268735 RepID=A0A3A6Q396_9EURY|nr:ribonuclease HII [Halonotius pteroides]RJX51589.1 ribonuclease HII [Halonotius pteroides]
MSAYQIGVDEAGKGPVLGPMVAAAVRADDSDLPDGIDDSKRLTAATRESIAAELQESSAVGVGLGVVTTDEIDDPETDMNSLTVAAQVRALSEVAGEGDHALVDAGDVSESRFTRRVADGAADNSVAIDVTAEHGADEASRLVGAASIIAKVERDSRIDAIGENYDRDIGSGYPSDPTTREFLAKYVDRRGELPACARTSWATCEDVVTAAEQSNLAEF